MPRYPSIAVTPRLWPPKAPQTGASMLEVLIAILVMSFGIAGAALLMAATIQYNKASQYQMVALQIANDLAESMRANSDGFMADAYATTRAYSANRSAATVPACSASAACSSSEIAQIDLAQTTNTLRRSLPGGDFNLQRNGSHADIWIMWLEPRAATSLPMDGANCRAGALTSGSDKPRCLYWRAAL